MTQCDAILKFIEEHGSITAKQAERHIGCMRLAARIQDLEERGYTFDVEMITVRTRNGKTKVARYTLNG